MTSPGIFDAPPGLLQHPYSQLWPPLDAATTAALDDDIAAVGVLDAIALLRGDEGGLSVLDGWNRYSRPSESVGLVRPSSIPAMTLWRLSCPRTPDGDT